MDIKQLRDIISKKDGERFCQFFLQMKPEEILELSKTEYDEIMRLAKQMKKEGIIRDGSFFDSLYNRARECLEIAESGRVVLPTARLSVFYQNLFLLLYSNIDIYFAATLANKGFSLRILAGHGVNTIENLVEAIKCYDEAAIILKKERSYLDYARTQMNKGININILAEQGVTTIENLQEAIKCYDKATTIFSNKKAELDYASTMTNKGISLRRLAEQGVNTPNNLRKSIKCYDEAIPIFKKERSDLNFARTMVNKGNSLRILAEQGVETIENLTEAIKCYDEADPIFKKQKAELDCGTAMMNKSVSLSILADHGVNTIKNLEETIKGFDEASLIFKREKAELDYARTLMGKGNSLKTLAQHEVNTIENLVEAIKCYDDAVSIFKREKAELSYARTLMNKGSSLLRLAVQGVNIIENLEKSINCYDDAKPIFKREKADLDLGRTMTNKGISLRMLAEQGIDFEKNFAAAMKLYQEAERIFLEQGSLLYFAMASANHITGLWWRFQITNEEEYLIQARNICKKALEDVPRITHPAKYYIIGLLFRNNAILADKYLASDKATFQEILKHVRRLPYIEEKIDFILDSIKLYTKQIIDSIKNSGEDVSEEIAKGFTSLADDLRLTNDEQQRKLLKELCRLLTDPTFQKNLLRESPPEKRGSIKSIFQRIGGTAKGVAGHVPAALVAHQIFYYFDRLWVEVLHLTPLHPALALGMVLSPFIAFKDRLSKS